jgi:hypothetical protein
MSYEIGDIIIFSGTPGHVGMVAAPDPDGDVWYIHAQIGAGFHFTQNQTKKDEKDEWKIRFNDWVYRPPWGAHPQFNKQTKQSELQRVANDISNYASYGGYRMVRLLIGSRTFGEEARARLAKYKQRRQDGFPRNKFVKNITCSEAVILCYQMTFDEGDHPFFIHLDAAHAMPKTLMAWLASSGWEKIQGP